MIGREESPLVRTIIWFRPVLKGEPLVLGTGLRCNSRAMPQGGAKATRTVLSKQASLQQLHFGATNEKEFGGQETAVVEIRAARPGDVS